MYLIIHVRIWYPTNPCGLRCNICKSYAMLGTCSHILTVTDMIMQARPAKDRLAECDVTKMLALCDENDQKTMGSSKALKANSGARALNKKTAVQLGKYSSKKSQINAERQAAKAREKKAQKESATAAKKLIAKKRPTKPKPAAKTKPPQKKKAKVQPVPDSSEEDSSEEL